MGENVVTGMERTLIHRLDFVLTSHTHLRRRGNHNEAQQELLDIYRNVISDLCYQALNIALKGLNSALNMAWTGRISTRSDDKGYMLIFACASGHHRSVAFVEILRRILYHHVPTSRVYVWHLDHTRANFAEHGVLDPFEASEDIWEEEFEPPLLNALNAPPHRLLHQASTTQHYR
jgi:hypothetical protein